MHYNDYYDSVLYYYAAVGKTTTVNKYFNIQPDLEIGSKNFSTRTCKA